MTEFIALGGASDPSGKKPPIGGSAYLIRHRNAGILVDFGVYHANERDDATESPPIKMERVGSLDIPIVPALTDLRLFQEGDSFFLTGSGQKYLPDYGPLTDLDELTVIATHGHLDHIGALPYLAQRFPRARIVMSHETLAFGMWIWRDHLKLSAQKKTKPLFNNSDIGRLAECVILVDAGTTLKIGDFELKLFSAGHIPGALSVLVTITEKGGRRPSRKIFVTGDTSFENQCVTPGAPLLDRESMPFLDALVMEATYAGREPKESRAETIERLLSRVETCMKNGGKFLAGALAIGRSQELFSILKNHGVTERWDVYVDGAAMEIASAFVERGHLGADIARHYVTDENMRRDILCGGKPCVMIAPAGMYTGGRSVQYAIAWSEGAENIIALTSYQNSCTPGAQLSTLKRGDKRTLWGVRLEWNASVEQFKLSAHAANNELEDMVHRLNPSHVLLVHGEDAGMDAFAEANGPYVRKARLDEEYEL